MRLPKSWNDITVEQFQECYFILGKNPKIDDWVLALSVLSGKGVKQIEDLSIKKLKDEINKLQFLLSPALNEKVNKILYTKGRCFKAVLDLSQMQTNQVADLKGFMTGEKPTQDLIVENFHRLLACIYLPLTFKGFKYVPSQHVKTSEYMKKVKIGDVYGTLFFYSDVYKALTKTTQDFGEKQVGILKEHMEEIQKWTTTKDGVGTQQFAT